MWLITGTGNRSVDYVNLSNTLRYEVCYKEEDIHRVSKKLCKHIFCQNFVKFRPIVKMFGKKIAKRTSFSGVYSFSTSPNLCQRTTVLNTDVPNCYITLCKTYFIIMPKIFTIGRNLTKFWHKNKFAQFFETRCRLLSIGD